MSTLSIVTLRLMTLLFVCFSKVSAQNGVFYRSTCPKVKAMPNFDIQAYASGIWYEAFRYPNELETSNQCLKLRYNSVNDIVYIETIGIPKNNQEYALIVGVQTAGARGTGNFTSIWVTGAPGESVIFDRIILETDYNNYAFNYGCVYNEKNNSHQIYFWIDTRDNIYRGKAKAAVEKFLSSTCLIKRNKLIPSDNSDAACKSASN